MLTASGGLHTNIRCEVLDADDEPIKNLYVAGATAGDFFANDYPTICPGIGHGRCITFGRIAGILAAGKSVDDIIPSKQI
jgi:predicted oxidoreductase